MYTFIFDVGKTNLKCLVLDDSGETVWSKSRTNQSSNTSAYLHFDVENIWLWLKAMLAEAATEFELTAINVSTHGACAVLLDNDGELLLPVMDYEFDGLVVADGNYDAIRPQYHTTHSPNLAAGLNLGRQLWWLQSTFPRQFQSLHQLLMYPQYWVWKLTGVAVTELSSLGCHTDLWEPVNHQYSALVKTLSIDHALPPIVNASSTVGELTADLFAEFGLQKNCTVYAGVHDSNASFARYLKSANDDDFTVISSGTWVISMCAGGSASLSEAKDMLSNVNVLGTPISCARFMGGREFEMICQLTGASLNDPLSVADVEAVIASQVFARPPFIDNSGPFKGMAEQGGLTGKVSSGLGLATLYLALMIDYELSLLNATGAVYIGSASKKNPLLCALIAQLRPQQKIYLSHDDASTVKGAWCLTRWQENLPLSLNDFELACSANIANLEQYRANWLA